MLTGLADPEARAPGAPTLASLDTEGVTLTGVTLFHLLCEIEGGPPCALLPPALHPTTPGVVGWLVYDCPESPWGAFRLVQMRVQCRSGVRPRGLLISGMIDNERAATALAGGWGYLLHPAEIEFERGYDRVRVGVRREAENLLEIGLREPARLPTDVVQFVSSLHPAHTPRGYRLVQVDPIHALSRAERGDPLVEEFDAAAWGEERIRPAYPISATICLADVTLPALRYLCRADQLAFTGTEPLRP